MKSNDIEQVTQLVIKAVSDRLGQTDPSVMAVVTREVVAAMSGVNAVPPRSTPQAPSSVHDNGDGTITTPLGSVVTQPGDGAALELCGSCLEQQRQRTQKRALVTTTGRNCKGVVASIASRIAEAGGDIQDISQTIVSGFFTMIMVVDINDLTVPFSSFKEGLINMATEKGIHAAVIHEDVLHALQRV